MTSDKAQELNKFLTNPKKFRCLDFEFKNRGCCVLHHSPSLILFPYQEKVKYHTEKIFYNVVTEAITSAINTSLLSAEAGKP